MARRSRPPRTRKSRKPEAPQLDVAVVIPDEAPVEELAREASAQSVSPPSDELSELDAGWD
jgi:hypothetical protein